MRGEAGGRFGERLMLGFLRRAPAVLFAVLVIGFSIASPAFPTPRNLVNLLIQASSAAIVATGMTLVLLAGGIDLSVGSIMYIAAALAGKMALAGEPLATVVTLAILAGAAFGAVNAVFVARAQMMAFIVTLATQYAGRGIGLRMTETRAMNLPDGILRIGTAKLFGIVPAPVLIAAAVLAAAHVLVTRTTFGRQILAVGQDREAARKAGVPVRRITAAVYILCGLCAAIAGLVSVAQLGAVSPTFGLGREFGAIAAAVLGGTSLFGGRGAVLPGTLLGALLIQMIDNGLNIADADPYSYPLVTAAAIFLAVWLDTAREARLAALRRRRIRTEEGF